MSGKCYLVRGGVSPLEQLSPLRIASQNLVGVNSGNLVYQYGVMRVLMTSRDDRFLMDRYKLCADDAGWINERCTALVIPLADAFRPDCARDFGRLTQLIRKLTIPCVVIGVGLRANLGDDLSVSRPFDPTVREFVDAVLEKSALVGLRGHTTGEYLRSLGYVEGKHYQVIGCPSMYAYGATLPKPREISLSRGSRINVTMNVYSQPEVTQFLMGVLDAYPNSIYTAQRLEELRTMLLGVPYTTEPQISPYPRTLDDPIYQQKRIRLFTHAKVWIDALGGMDLAVGGRLHGSVASILAGVPTVVIPRDHRMSELVTFHDMPHVSGPDVREHWTLEELLEQVKWGTMYERHAQNFAAYHAFLQANGLETIFDAPDGGACAPMDEVLRGQNLAEHEVYPTTAPQPVRLGRRIWCKVKKEELNRVSKAGRLTPALKYSWRGKAR